MISSSNRHRLGGLAQHDQRLAATQPAEGHQVRIPEPVSDPGRFVEGLIRPCRVARTKALQCGRNKQVAPLNAVTPTALVEHPARPGEPARGARHFPAKQ
jgi:hypothetical protein